MTTEQIVGWGLLGLSPFLAPFMALGVYNAVCKSRCRENFASSDDRNDDEYRMWRERLMARGGLEGVFCPVPTGGELCYACAYDVSLYAPADGFRSFHAVERSPVFDTGCGVSVSRGWSVFDHFGSVAFRGKGTLYVTARHVYLKGGSVNLAIPLDDIRVVTAACSSLMLGVLMMEQPLLINAVNGQKIRDVLHVLMNERGLLCGD